MTHEDIIDKANAALQTDPRTSEMSISAFSMDTAEMRDDADSEGPALLIGTSLIAELAINGALPAVALAMFATARAEHLAGRLHGEEALRRKLRSLLGVRHEDLD